VFSPKKSTQITPRLRQQPLFGAPKALKDNYKAEIPRAKRAKGTKHFGTRQQGKLIETSQDFPRLSRPLLQSLKGITSRE